MDSNYWSIFHITKDVFYKTVYFTLLRYKTDDVHKQGTSSKRDMLGGYIDRWVNYMAPVVIFNGLLNGSGLKVVSDYFLYDMKSDKNAPDIIGLTDDQNKIVDVFTVFCDGTWIHKPNKPFIEVKTLRKNQYMVGLRDSQFNDDHIYCFVEADLNTDYLTYLFDDGFFSDEVFKSMIMDPVFINSDKNKHIITPDRLKKPDNIGTMRLLGIYTGKELRNNCSLFGLKEDFYFLKELIPTEKTIKKETQLDGSSELYEYKHNNSIKYLPFLIRSDSPIYIGKKYKSCCYINSEDIFYVNGVSFKGGSYKLSFSKFERTSTWKEYISYKSIFDSSLNNKHCQKPRDYTNELINSLIKLKEENRHDPSRT